MRKDKPCTGEKFGSESCPPGSKRYNLAKTFRKMAKEGHKLASLEKASVLSASDDPKDQDKAREIRVRHDYESLKKQIGSKKRPTKPAVNEAKVDKGRSDYGKASIRNYRRFGPGHGEPAMFDPENKRGKAIDKRRKEGQDRRGVKGAKVPAYKVSEAKDAALEYVKNKYKGQIYDPKKKQSPEDKAKVAAERKKRQDADNKAYAARAKKAGFKSTQDYTDVVARYGSEDNYKKGRGLGT